MVIAQTTGGVTASACASDYGVALKKIANIAANLEPRFFLATKAQPSTIAVTIGDKPCPGAKASCGSVCPPGAKGWKYEPTSNSVQLVPKSQGGTCAASVGQIVSIHYVAECFP